MKYLKYGLGILLLLIVLLIIYVKVVIDEPRPEIIEGQSATEMSEMILQAVNKAAWDTLPLVSWTFRGSHHFVWDRGNNDALINWDDYTVHLDPDEISGKAYKGQSLLSGEDHDKAIQDAWSHWCNDMFWLSAPYKINDKGVKLNIAKDQDGKKGLLVTYASGGVTPGDSYLWYLDNNGLPTGYKMWVKIIPIGGIYTSWEDWTTLAGGAKVAAMHQGNLDFLKIDITNIKSGFSWNDLGYDSSPIKL